MVSIVFCHENILKLSSCKFLIGSYSSFIFKEVGSIGICLWLENFINTDEFPQTYTNQIFQNN